MSVCRSNPSFAGALAGAGASFLSSVVAGLPSLDLYSNEVRANESC
jgi:hypothetical protein